MTIYLRHSSRHLHRTVFDYLAGQLEELGWTVSGSVPFNSPVVKMQEVLPDEWKGDSVLAPGTLAVTLGDEPSAEGQELGGPLAQIEIPLFVDCFMDTPATTLALALDVRDIFCGRLPGTVRYLNVTDYNDPDMPVADGYSIEFTDVTRERIKKDWEVIKVTVVLTFPEVTY